MYRGYGEAEPCIVWYRAKSHAEWYGAKPACAHSVLRRGETRLRSDNRHYGEAMSKKYSRGEREYVFLKREEN